MSGRYDMEGVEVFWVVLAIMAFIACGVLVGMVISFSRGKDV